MPRPFRRRWYQFSLRTLLASTLVFGAVLGWIAIKFENARRQRATLAAIERLGGKIEYVFRDPPSIWKCAFIDDEVASEVSGIQLPPRRNETIECLKLCTKLKHLRALNLGRTDLEAADIADVKRLPDLATLAVFSTPVGDDVLGLAGELPKLAVQQLVNASVSDAGLRKLAKAKNLVMLVIIGSPEVGDDGLAGLAALQNLDTLTLERTSVTDAGLVHLEKLRNLRNLNLSKTAVSMAGIDRLQRALPKCKIVGP